VRLIGDVHGKFGAYSTIIKQYPDTIQIGDMGIGFFNWPHGEAQSNPPYDKMVASNARFIRGNHDNPNVCKKHSQWIADGTIEGDVMFVGGAWSIDWEYRTEGYSYWKDEELSHSEFYDVMDKYETNRPRIMVTHDCPEQLLPYLVSHHSVFTTRTGQAFANMFERYQPKLWVFGHHHKSFDMEVNGTRFVCLAELETKEFD
jgi:Icc-related predicted phosphoesterase